MTWDEYNKLFHKTQANLTAFQPLMQCDHEVIRMIDAAVAEEREACAQLCDEKVEAEYATGKVDHNEMGWTQACAIDIRARGQA
jgi:hypothetical protein